MLIVFWLFVSKKNTKIWTRVTRDPVSGFRVGIDSIYMEKAVLEYFVRRVVTNSLEVVCTNCQNTENSLRISSTDYKERQRHDNVTGL
jgi:hypothetical protein